MRSDSACDGCRQYTVQNRNKYCPKRFVQTALGKKKKTRDFGVLSSKVNVNCYLFTRLQMLFRIESKWLRATALGNELLQPFPDIWFRFLVTESCRREA